ncbi:glycosyltransferase [Hydrogenophaga sp. 2FB]|uniref:glycosyltransferase n=1 Tax=Hydrogenophaga sp. 2FB TaxID=2502187 RepID=UPI0010F67173|nr:glycosyltransferase [Hydrogenophaga sp. 2FB]
MKRGRARSPRIFLGITEVSGYFSRLRLGLLELGADAVHVSVHAHQFGYEAGPVPWIVAWSRRAVARRAVAADTSRLRSAVALTNVIASRSALLVWAMCRFDVFILGAGSSFFALRELALLRWLGKRVIYTLHGTDARPPYIDGFFPALRPALDGQWQDSATADRALDELATEVARRVRFLRRLERYADVIVCGPSYGHFLSRSYVNFYAIGLPTPLPAPESSAGKRKTPTPATVVLHAPSQTAGKGTALIRNIVTRLQQEGMPIDYREISGRPNHEVMAALREADVVIDQAWSDTPMAGFAAEAAASGCPALVGGYFSALVGEAVPESWRPPTTFVAPEQLEEGLRDLAADPQELARLGEVAREYVSAQWSQRAVAAKMLQLVQEVPPEWLVAPASCPYLEGCGLTREQARSTVRRLIDRHGIGALGLSHAPALQKAFATFAQAEAGDV